jgi:DNA uptake protein ComE-like DNA-binding protein
VTFEDLRSLGLSVTQAKRVISQREASGGFSSVDELGQLPGFSRWQLEQLKRALTV